MKILYYYQYYGTPAGSWSSRVYELTRRWVREGHPVTVITAPYEKSDIRADRFITRMEVEGVKLIVINSPDSNRQGVVRRGFNALRFSLVSVWFALTLNYDIAIASSGPITVAIPALLANWFRAKKFVFEIRDLWPAGAIEMKLIKANIVKTIGLWFEQLIYHHSSLIVTASEGQKKYILPGLKGKTVEVIPNVADLKLYSTLLVDPGYIPDYDAKSVFVHIGSLGLIHNCMFILEAAREISKQKPDHSILIFFIGEGSERKELEEFVKKENLHFVIFTGLKPKHYIPFWLSKSVASLFTTLDNPIQDTSCPNKVFDSFAAGVPVIQTTRGWLKDEIEIYECGINVSPGNAGDMASEMLRLAGNKDLQVKLGKNALQLAITKYNTDIQASMYLEHICKI